MSRDFVCVGGGPVILNHHPARFGVHRPNGTENNGVYSISSNSNSNFISNAEVYKWPIFTYILVNKRKELFINITLS